jgi:glucose-1-phosphate adenylyltransferase
MPSLNDVLAMIMGGGVGKRLYPLTKQRAKPAVPIAGKYRLIDVPISNCINSGLSRIAVLTQFNSVSLHRHITQTYTFDDFHNGWVQILAAEQTPRSADWYQGTADAVRKQLFEIRHTLARYVLILSGDHLYRMDYAELAQQHWAKNADITIAVQPVPTQEVSRYGILKCASDGKIDAFVEKTRDPELLQSFVSRDDPDRPYLGSTGIYLFNIDALIDLLENSAYDDFGSQIIPNSLASHEVYGYVFDGFWVDIGTIRSFYETNLVLAQPDAPFNFHDPDRPIYTRTRYLPGSVVSGASLSNVLIAEGCRIGSANISNSVIGLRSQISDGVVLENTIIMGSDYYDHPDNPLPGRVPLGLAKNCRIAGSIIDKNARIGEGSVIEPFPRGFDHDAENWVVQDGIVVIPKNTILHPGTYIGPHQ